MIAYGGEKMDASVAVLCVISQKIGERGGSRVCDTKFLISQRSYNVKNCCISCFKRTDASFLGHRHTLMLYVSMTSLFLSHFFF